MLTVTKWRKAIHIALCYGGNHIFRGEEGEENQNGIEYNKICSKYMDDSMKSFRLRITIILLSICTLNAGPMYEQIFKGAEASTALEIRIPFVAEKSLAEYFIISVYQIPIAVNGIYGYTAMEVAMELIFGVLKVSPILIKHEFQKFDEKINQNIFTKMQTLVTLRNIVQQIMDTDE